MAAKRSAAVKAATRRVVREPAPSYRGLPSFWQASASPERDTPLLLDTHTWLWTLDATSGALSAGVRGVIEQAARNRVLHVSDFSFWEVAMLVSKGRLELAGDVGAWLERAGEAPGIITLPVTRTVLVQSTRLPGVPHGRYVAVKFYFSDSFPATDANRAFVRRVLGSLAARGRVVSLTTGLHLDDHGGAGSEPPGVEPLPAGVEPRINLALQSAIVANASAFVGTYGGFSYLAPFYGVPTTAYYDAERFSRKHLAMAQTAFAALGNERLLDVRDVRMELQ